MLKIRFGECLYLLLNTLDISNKRLAKYLNVDPSLISKWVHGIRIPSYDSTYIDKITAYICENIINSFQEDKINELLNESNFHINTDMTIREKIKAVLVESQGYSKESCCDTYKEFPITDLRTDKSEFELDKSNISTLSSEDMILFSYEEIFSKMLNMLLKASRINNVPDKPIIITFFEGMRYLFLSDEYIIKIKTIVNKLIRKGWKFTILVNINENINNLKHFIKKMRLTYLDNINIFYLKKYNDVILSKEVFVIPNVEALTCYSLDDNIMDTAFAFKNEKAIEALYKYVIKMIKSFSLPLYTNYPVYKREKYNDLLVNTEKIEGDQYFLGSNFHILSLSKEQYKKYLNINYSKRVRENHMNRFNQRVFNLNQNLKVFKVKEIYIIESIMKYIKDQVYIFDNGQRYDSYNFANDEVIEQIKNVIDKLKSFPNYEVALINRSMIYKGNKVNLLIKDNYTVLVKTKNGNANSTCISIKEPTVVNSFKIYFLELWDEIPVINKDKEMVISWLERQIETLKRIDTKAV